MDKATRNRRKDVNANSHSNINCHLNALYTNLQDQGPGSMVPSFQSSCMQSRWTAVDAGPDRKLRLLRVESVLHGAQLKEGVHSSEVRMRASLCIYLKDQGSPST